MRAWSWQFFFLNSVSIPFLVEQVHRLDRRELWVCSVCVGWWSSRWRLQRSALYWDAYNLSDEPPPTPSPCKGNLRQESSDDTTGLCVCVVERSSCVARMKVEVASKQDSQGVCGGGCWTGRGPGWGGRPVRGEVAAGLPRLEFTRRDSAAVEQSVWAGR